jgi:hypothetical protein
MMTTSCLIEKTIRLSEKYLGQNINQSDGRLMAVLSDTFDQLTITNTYTINNLGDVTETITYDQPNYDKQVNVYHSIDHAQYNELVKNVYQRVRDRVVQKYVHDHETERHLEHQTMLRILEQSYTMDRANREKQFQDEITKLIDTL